MSWSFSCFWVSAPICCRHSTCVCSACLLVAVPQRNCGCPRARIVWQEISWKKIRGVFQQWWKVEKIGAKSQQCWVFLGYCSVFRAHTALGSWNSWLGTLLTDDPFCNEIIVLIHDVLSLSWHWYPPFPLSHPLHGYVILFLPGFYSTSRFAMISKIHLKLSLRSFLFYYSWTVIQWYEIVSSAQILSSQTCKVVLIFYFSSLHKF